MHRAHDGWLVVERAVLVFWLLVSTIGVIGARIGSLASMSGIIGDPTCDYVGLETPLFAHYLIRYEVDTF